jgi:hypothetical protein
MAAVAAGLPEMEKLRLIRNHPDLAGRLGIADLTAAFLLFGHHLTSFPQGNRKENGFIPSKNLKVFLWPPSSPASMHWPIVIHNRRQESR